MRKGWNAEGLLLPLWQNYPGKRDGLAAKVGSSGSTLSAINQGRRNLGYDLGSRLAVALEVSVLQLGAPLDGADEVEDQTLLGRLEDLASKLADSIAKQAAMEKELRSLRTRVGKLEALRAPSQAVSRRPLEDTP